MKPHQLFSLVKDQPDVELTAKVSSASRKLLFATLREASPSRAVAVQAAAKLIGLTASTVFDLVYCGGDDAVIRDLHAKAKTAVTKIDAAKIALEGMIKTEDAAESKIGGAVRRNSIWEMVLEQACRKNGRVVTTPAFVADMAVMTEGLYVFIAQTRGKQGNRGRPFGKAYFKTACIIWKEATGVLPPYRAAPQSPSDLFDVLAQIVADMSDNDEDIPKELSRDAYRLARKALDE